MCYVHSALIYIEVQPHLLIKINYLVQKSGFNVFAAIVDHCALSVRVFFHEKGGRSFFPHCVHSAPSLKLLLKSATGSLYFYLPLKMLLWRLRNPNFYIEKVMRHFLY